MPTSIHVHYCGVDGLEKRICKVAVILCTREVRGSAVMKLHNK